ncbi:MAG TPA: hypothetical protein GXZ52_00745 [Clostridiales bacterium]|jgi:hypothetical protein|nr:hypothetical protein [Clostridiales bacterium]
MTVDFSDRQFSLLKEIIAEYRDCCYQGIIDYQKAALAAEDAAVKREYKALAQGEEDRFVEVKELLEYIEKFEELMKNRP